MDEYTTTLLSSENVFDALSVAAHDVDESPLVDEDSYWSGGPITWCVIA
jgi:hypothetical protein